MITPAYVLEFEATRLLNYFGGPYTKRDGNNGKISMAAARTFERSTAAFEQRLADASILQIVNPKGEMKGSAITGPVGKEAAELWPVFSTLSTV